MGMLRDGFGAEKVTATEFDESVCVTVTGIEGRFVVDKFGDIGEIPEIDAELAYWINTDLQCLDLLETEKEEGQ